MLTYLQTDFGGGMNLLSDDALIQPNQYVYGINVRSRNGYVEPAQSPLEMDAPEGLKQGLYIIGEIIVLFVAGKAWYRLLGSSTWTQIAGFSMDADVTYIYACAVPASSVKWIRKTTLSGGTVSAIDTNGEASASPVALVCQDGINQPWVIFPDGTARVTQTYAQWSLTGNMEYVPIGTAMCMFGNMLWVVNDNVLYYSVIGRPLDFVVAIADNGDKVADATGTQIAVDFSAISCIRPMSSDELLVGTAYRCYILKQSGDVWFGQPIYRPVDAQVGGVVNQFAITDLLGDVAIVDYEGIVTFNAVKQLKFEGRTSMFSRTVDSLFTTKGIPAVIQDVVACITFNAFALFSVKTTMGYGIVVYDTQQGNWQGIDITECNKVKQFAISTSRVENKLFAITENKLFEMFAGGTAAPALQTRMFVNAYLAEKDRTLQVEQKIVKVRAAFTAATVDGTVYASEVIDGRKGTAKSKTLRSTIGSIEYPVDAPVMQGSGMSVDNVVIQFSDGKTGLKNGLWLTWTSDARLSALQLECNAVPSEQSGKQAL